MTSLLLKNAFVTDCLTYQSKMVVCTVCVFLLQNAKNSSSFYYADCKLCLGQIQEEEICLIF